MRRALCLLLAVLIIMIVSACRLSTDSSGTNQKQLRSAPSRYTTAPSDSSIEAAPPTTMAVPTAWEHEAALSRFLAQTNHEGTIKHDPSAGVQPPGTLPDVQFIPVADQTLIGVCVPIIFAQEQYAVPFYYSYDPTTGAERLAVVVLAERIPMLIIFETELGGIGGLCQKITQQEPFDATILSVTNISYEEGCVYATNAAFLSAEAEEIIDIWGKPVDCDGGIYIGLVGSDSAGNAHNILKGAQAGNASEALQSSIDVYLKIFTRFDLLKFIEF